MIKKYISNFNIKSNSTPILMISFFFFKQKKLDCANVITRGGNRAGKVGFGFESGRSDQFNILEEIGSDRIGSIYMLCFFRSLIDFNWIEGHLISSRIGSGQVRVRSVLLS
jgi:hypothetical protein